MNFSTFSRLGLLRKVSLLVVVLLGLTTVIGSGGGGGGNGNGLLPDTDPPEIVGSVPTNGAIDIPQHPAISVTFNEEMDPATINTTTFTLKDASNNPVSGNIIYSGYLAYFSTSAGLDYLATYTATVTTGVTDLAGNHMAADFTWTFTTISAPQVTSTSPADLQNQLLSSIVISAVFNRDINPDTINSSSFTITDTDLNPVSGVINASGTTASFTPNAPLDYGTTYIATLTTDIAETTGNNLPSDYVWSFSTIGVLGNAVNIESSSDIVSCASTIFDSNNNGHVIWNQGPNYSSDSVWANIYTSMSGWGTAVAIESSVTDIWGCPAISGDGNGNLVAVWSQGGVITMNRYSTGSGWDTPQTVGGSAGNTPKVAMDSNSNIFVVWEESLNIWARRYEQGIGWDTATTIESYSTEAYTPDVVVDNSGDATVVWSQQQSGLLFFAAANRYEVGGGWGTPAMISTGSSGLLNNEVVAGITGSGHVFAAWSMGSTTFTLRTNRYVPGVGWGTETTIDTDLITDSVGPDIASVSDDASVVWSKVDGIIYSASYLNGSGWQTASVLANGGSNNNPTIAISNAGKITVAWNHQFWNGDDWEYGTRVIQYVSASGWGDAQLLAPNNSQSFGIDLATDSSGNFLATWTEGPGPTADVVMANIFQ